MAIYILACSIQPNSLSPPGRITITTTVSVDTPAPPRRVTMRYSLGGGVHYDFCPELIVSRGPRDLAGTTGTFDDPLDVCPSPPPPQNAAFPVTVEAQQIDANGSVIDSATSSPYLHTKCP